MVNGAVMPHLDPGDWPTWISAITSALALLAAITATWISARTWRREK